MLRDYYDLGYKAGLEDLSYDPPRDHGRLGCQYTRERYAFGYLDGAHARTKANVSKEVA